MNNSGIVILFPTAQEMDPFTASDKGGYATVLCGVGLAECAARTAAAIARYRPRVAILAGIAGAYPGSGLERGEAVMVARENSADLGSVAGEVGFRPIAKSGGQPQDNFYLSDAWDPGLFPAVVSNSVNTAATSLLNSSLAPAAIENMEGAAFFAACQALGIPCLEIRVVSNIVGEGPATWNVAGSAGILAASLEKLLASLTA